MSMPMSLTRKELDHMVQDWIRPFIDYAGFPIDSIEDSSTLTIKADLAGVDKKDISVTHAKNSITIRASRPCFEGNKRDYNLWLERPCGNLERVIRLAEPIDEASMQASLKEGVLTVKATKHYTASPSKVEIQ